VHPGCRMVGEWHALGTYRHGCLEVWSLVARHLLVTLLLADVLLLSPSLLCRDHQRNQCEVDADSLKPRR
jgi:hypothetical protein